MKTLDANLISARELYAGLTGAVSPRPIALVSTVDANGAVNLAPFSFFNIVSANPPILVFSCVDSLRDGSSKDTLYNAEETKEVVINLVNYQMVEQTSLSSTAYPKGVNEFEKAGFTELASLKVKAPRVAESPVQIECSVEEIIKFGEDNGSGNLVICKVLSMHISNEILDEKDAIDPYKLDIVSRLGGSWYGRANQGLFEVAKPLSSIGIGIGALPEAVRNSEVLTGNDLGKLGNVELLPDKLAVDAYIKEDQFLQAILEKQNINELHLYAQELLQKGNIEAALCVLSVELNNKI